MKSVLFRNVAFVCFILILFGCEKKNMMNKQSVEPPAQKTNEKMSAKTLMSDYGVILTLQTNNGRPDWGPIESFLAEIGPDTPLGSPALSYLRDNLEILFERGVLDNFLGAWRPLLNAVRNPEFIRLIHQVYASERDAHRFWKAGVTLMDLSGDQPLASGLFEDWKKLPMAELANLRTGTELTASVFAPKRYLAGAIFSLKNNETIAEIWSAFPLMSVDDQYVILDTSSSYHSSFFTKENLHVLLSLPDSGKHQGITAMLTQFPSRIVLKLLQECPDGDKAALLRNLADKLALMEKNGIVSEELSMTLRRVGK